VRALRALLARRPGAGALPQGDLLKLDLLVDAPEFWRSLEADVRGAGRSVYVQALSFEGDRAGRALGHLLLDSRAADRRVLVDSFTRHVVSDRFLWRPDNLVRPALRRETDATRGLHRRLGRAGVALRFTNPPGPLLVRLPFRNHKKLVIVDGHVAYLGGINFSDHNFEWHDLMLRIDDEDAAAWLRDDFLATWEGGRPTGTRSLAHLALSSLDGRSNPAAFAPVLALLESARRTVFVTCPYITSPFTDALRGAAAQGVTVTVVAPAHNNWPVFPAYLRRQARRGGFSVRFYRPRMSHLKAMLIDDRHLVVGSANYDFLSYRFQQEYVAVVTDPLVLASFRERVVRPDLDASSHAAPAFCPGTEMLSTSFLAVVDRAARLLGRAVGPPPGLADANETSVTG
jgi:cardiolipin synthase